MNTWDRAWDRGRFSVPPCPIEVNYNNSMALSNIYTYDSRGNITAKNEYAYTTGSLENATPTSTRTFTYAASGWTDKLTAVDNTPLTYDAIGNVLTYGNRNFTWSNGRYLAQITEGTDTYSYTYDENGIRTSKTVNGVTTQYNTKDGVILAQSDGTNTMTFQYDTSGLPLGFTYNGAQYTYLVSQSGIIMAVMDSTGHFIVGYDYDEWGKPINTYFTDRTLSAEQIAAVNANPLRYKGYYYDHETGYYYLQSRYYDPSICRFINSDLPQYAIVQKNVNVGLNSFAYCCNDAVNSNDPSGCVAPEIALTTFYALLKAILIAFFAYFAANVVYYTAVQNLPNNYFGKSRYSVNEKLNKSVDLFTVVKTGLWSLALDIAKRVKKNKKRNSNQVHHIVPRNIRLTVSKNPFIEKYAHYYYLKAGHSIEATYNKIKLKSRFHSAINTNLYYSFVFKITKQAYSITNNSKHRHTFVMIAVIFVRCFLSVMNKMSPK